jgi:arylformamidase
MDIHTGTHIDAPAHFLDGAPGVDSVDLRRLVGRCEVFDLGTAEAVTREVLEEAGLRQGAKRVLLRTTNSELWSSRKGFSSNYVALDEGAAQFIVECGVDLIGIDYLSVQRFTDGPEVHEILLRSRVLILEGIQLASVRAGHYELVCLPLALTGAEGAPARAVLRPME